MSLVGLVFVIVFIGVILWLVNTYSPMKYTRKRILNIVVLVVVILWILSVFGILPDINQIRVGN